jgi:hypothetical protein
MGKIITLEIPEDVNRRLEEEAYERGVKPEVLVLEWLKRMTEEERYRKGRRRASLSAEEEIARFGVYQMGQFKPLTRDELYGDR